MSYIKNLFVSVVLVGALAACVKPAAPQAMVQGVHRIGVISAVGDQLNFQRMGITRFTNAKDTADTSDWGLTDFVEGAVSKRLQGRYSVEEVVVDRAALRASGITASEVARHDKENRSGKPLDAYVVIVPKKATVSVSGFNFVPIEGLMVFQKDIPFVMNTWVCTSVEVVLVHRRYLEEFRRVPLELNIGMMMREVDGVMTDRNLRFVDNEGDWPGDLASLSQGQIQKLKSAYMSLLRAQIDDSLTLIGLAQ